MKKGTHIQVAYPGTPNVGGTLIAEGTAEKPIRFANKDAENWASLYVYAPGTARLAYVTFENGGGGDFEDGATINVLGDSEMPAKAILYVDHVTVKGSKGTGVWLQRGANFAAGSKDLTITSSGSDESPFPLQIEEHAIDALPTGSYTGNKIDEILLRTSGMGSAGNGLTLDATLHERGVPYRMGKAKLDDFIVGPTGDGPAATLTIEAGVVMRFEKETAFRVQTFDSDEPALAAIRALGTADKPIVFTSASPTPAAGDWRGLWFGGAPLATNKLDHVRIEYAGFDCRCSLVTCSGISEHDGAIVLTGQAPGAFVTNTLFKAIGGHAITQGFTGDFIDFRPSNTFEDVSGCKQTLPRTKTGVCDTPLPPCDGM
ncbi:MAG: Fibronectin type domain protein [Labilithrix sp.]|nr:Fibronectin type domain protein [Labilithrix sp.]